jgi:8-oxo-dGTP diphosphatase
MPDERPLTEVAVGVVFDRQGRVLLGQRPAGKPYAGWWEFPGGKLEPGESVATALARELHEELGIRVHASSPWIVREHSYPHARVRLHFRRVFDWSGEPVSREGQAFDWTAVGDIDRETLLPAAVPVLAMLALPRRLVRVAAGRLVAREDSATRAGAVSGGRARGRHGRALFVLEPGGVREPGSPLDARPLEAGLARLRAIPGAVVCAGDVLVAAAGSDPIDRIVAACDGILARPDRLPGRDARSGLAGLSIARVEDLGLVTQVDADFAVIDLDVSMHLPALEEAMALASMPVYLAVARERNPGPRPPGLHGFAWGGRTQA